MVDKAKLASRMKAYNARPEQKAKRAARGRLRYQLEKEGRVAKGDGMDVDHKKPLSKGGANTKANARVVSKSKNRGHGMSRGGGRTKGS